MIISRGPFTSRLRHGPGVRISHQTADPSGADPPHPPPLIPHTRRETHPDHDPLPTGLDRISQSILGNYAVGVFRTWEVCASEGRGTAPGSCFVTASASVCRAYPGGISARFLTPPDSMPILRLCFALATWHTDMVHPPVLPSKPRIVRIEVHASVYFRKLMRQTRASGIGCMSFGRTNWGWGCI